jgi:lipoprotein-anchoring transpeptidase ErfK/SrfK
MRLLFSGTREDDMRSSRTIEILAFTTMAALCGRTAAAANGPRAVVDATVVRRIVVSLPDRRLALIENDEVISVYPVAVGAPISPSPAGTFSVVNRVANPTYYKPGTVIAPGAANPIGTRWIGLSAKGYGIHGTDRPKSIGFAKSHGCIRLRNEDIERLFERVRPGDVVELHAERTPETARLFTDAPHP